jgi:hypothetical protein
MIPIRTLVLAAVLPALAGCETIAWQRPGTDEATFHQDYRQCRWQARLEARRALSLDSFALPRGAAGPVPCFGSAARRSGAARADGCLVGPSDGYLSSRSSGLTSRMILEQRAVDRCLRARGYELDLVDDDDATDE